MSAPELFADDRPLTWEDPYPSAAEYDAKVWPLFRHWRETHPGIPALIWNVSA